MCASYRMYFPECVRRKFEDFFSGYRKKVKKEIERYEKGSIKNNNTIYGCNCSGSLLIDGEKFGINFSNVDEIHKPFLPEDVKRAKCYGLVGGENIEKVKELLRPIKVEEDK